MMKKPKIRYTNVRLLDRAKEFSVGRRWNRAGKIAIDPLLLKSPSVRKALEGMILATGCSREDAEDALMRAHNLGEILTVEELAARLKVDPAWIKHRRHSRSKNKIPALDILGRSLRFDWDAIVKWLEGASQEEETPSPRKKRC
jgi:Helix-turn-helix domain